MSGEVRAEVAEVLAAHRWVDAVGDNDWPNGRYFGCSCGWTHRIDGMSGWSSWRAAHDEHLADALAPLLDRLTQERDRAREQVARVEEQIAHAQANDHHLDLMCQGVDPFQDLPPAVRIDYIKAALKERP